jgi:transcriptional regulator with XRE-family HTH domain
VRLRTRLKELRERAGLSQEQAARRMRTTSRTYARWERGEVGFPVGRVDELAKAFNVPPADLLIDSLAELESEVRRLRRDLDALRPSVRPDAKLERRAVRDQSKISSVSSLWDFLRTAEPDASVYVEVEGRTFLLDTTGGIERGERDPDDEARKRITGLIFFVCPEPIPDEERHTQGAVFRGVQRLPE